MAFSGGGVPGENARGAPGQVQSRRASIVLLRTLGRRGRRVLLTPVLLIEERERQRDEAGDQGDFKDKEEEGEQQARCHLPQDDADDTYGGKLKHWLHHQMRSEREGRGLYVNETGPGFNATWSGDL